MRVYTKQEIEKEITKLENGEEYSIPFRLLRLKFPKRIRRFISYLTLLDYRDNNREKLYASAREWKKRNKEKIRVYQREYMRRRKNEGNRNLYKGG